MMTHPAAPEATPEADYLLYCLLAAFCGEPMLPHVALAAAGLLTTDQGPEELTDEQRDLLRTLTAQGRIRWVTPKKQSHGYTLTGYGETALTTYRAKYGPVYPRRQGPSLREVAERNRQRDELLHLLEQRRRQA